jgi:hypothetical protein
MTSLCHVWGVKVKKACHYPGDRAGQEGYGGHSGDGGTRPVYRRLQLESVGEKNQDGIASISAVLV